MDICKGGADTPPAIVITPCEIGPPCCEDDEYQFRRPCCKQLAFGEASFCGISQKQREEEAIKKVNNRIFFMGITKYGYQKPIREAVNPTYRDAPAGRPSLSEFLPDPNAKNIDYGQLAEKFHYMDIYTGLVDGRNYGRTTRLLRHKLRHARHPHGPNQKFCVPIANSMNYGWWMRDQKMLDETKWYQVYKRFPQVRGEITRFVDEMALHTPNFRLF